MKYYDTILETVGHTPLVKLNKVTAGLKPLILAKIEAFNPGGSIKDRPAIKMIEAAEKEGLLKPGGTIIEPTSGNTGVGLAQVASVRGYRCIFVCPDKVASEKTNLLKAYGAEVVITPTDVLANSYESYYSVANKLTNEIPGAFQPNQYANPNNPNAHFLSTGPEIWDATEGKVTCFVAGMGTGGTISGIARYLKEKNPKIKIIGADPEGSIFCGDLAHSYKVEGIGEDFIPRTMNLKIVDEIIRVSDKDSFIMTRRIAREEGMLLGGSSGSAIVAALQAAKNMTKNDVIVILMPDGGRSYLSKVYSDEWMQSNGFLPTTGINYYIKDLLHFKPSHQKLPAVVNVNPDSTIQHAIELMEQFQVNQLPVLDRAGKNVGSISDIIAMQVVYERKDPSKITVNSLMGKPYPQFDLNAEIDQAYKAFKLGIDMVVITDKNKVSGVLTKFDIMTHMLESITNKKTIASKKVKKTTGAKR